MTMRSSVAKGAVFTMCRLVSRRHGPIQCVLLYHSIGEPGGVPTSRFERQVSYLTENFDVLPLPELVAHVSSERSAVAITFDDGYVDNLDRAAPILERAGIRGTFFVATSFLGRTFPTSWGEREVMTAGQLRDLARSGHIIGAHTATHPKLTHIPPADAEREIIDGKRKLEDILGSAVSAFAYPKGDFDAKIRQIVERSEFELAVTVREGHLAPDGDRFTLPRVSVGRHDGRAVFRGKLSAGLPLYERLRGRS